MSRRSSTFAVVGCVTAAFATAVLAVYLSSRDKPDTVPDRQDNTEQVVEGPDTASVHAGRPEASIE